MSSYQVNGGDQRGAQFGDSYTYITQGSLAYDPNFDFELYTESVRGQLKEEAAKLIQLDLEQLVLEVDDRLKVVNGEAVRLAQAVRNQRRVIVIGSAGSGKTSSLKGLIAAEDDGELRIFVELARYRRSDASDLDCLLQLVGEVVADSSGAAMKPSNELLRRVLKEKRVLLLLDGLNEVDADLRARCMRAIGDLQTFDHCRVLLATRGHNFTPPRDWTIFRLRELTDGQIRTFLDEQQDPATREAVLDLLAIDDNPLLRLPLFLKFLMELVHAAPVGEKPLVSSRTKIVALYVERLFSREQSRTLTAFDIDSMRETLSRLAIHLQSVGQSISLEEAGEALGTSPEVATATIDGLAARGFIQRDARYVRFWHHTLQEYFYATGLRMMCFPARQAPRRKLLKTVLGRLSEEDALAFMTVGASDSELALMMEIARKRNIALATRWADDLSVDSRGEAVVDALFARFREQMGRIAIYSRLTYYRRCYLKLFGLAFTGAAIYGLRWPWGWLSGGSGAYHVSLLVGVIGLYILLTMTGVVILHSLLRYPGCDRAAAIFGEARNVVAGSLRQRYAALAAVVSTLPLASFELKELATIVSRPRCEDDVLQYLRSDRGLYLSIDLLAFAEDARLVRLLKAVALAGRGNAYSCAAMEAMRRRVINEPNERETLEKLARAVWDDAKLPWKYRRIAGRSLVTLNAQFRGTFLRKCLVRGLAIVLAIAIAGAIIEAVAFLATYLLLIVLANTVSDQLPTVIWVLTFIVLPVVIATSVYIHARAAGIRRIPGYFALDACPPWFYAGSAFLVGFFSLNAIPLVLYWINKSHIRANAKGVDMQLVRTLLETETATVN